MRSVSGVITTPLALGALSVTGLGFQPTGVLFFSFGTTQINTLEQFYALSMGATDGVNSWTKSSSHDNGSPNLATDMHYADRVINVKLYDNAYAAAASLTSLDTDGFTLNFISIAEDVTSHVQYGVKVHYVAFGECDVAVGTAQSHADGSVQSVTGLAFTPVGLITAALYTINPASTWWSLFSAGFASTIGDQWSWRAGADTRPIANAQDGRFWPGELWTGDQRAAFQGFISDGFSWQCFWPGAVDYTFSYMVFGGEGITAKADLIDLTGLTTTYDVHTAASRPDFVMGISRDTLATNILTGGFDFSDETSTNDNGSAAEIGSGYLCKVLGFDGTDNAPVDVVTESYNITTRYSDGFRVEYSSSITGKAGFFQLGGEMPSNGSLPILGVG